MRALVATAGQVLGAGLLLAGLYLLAGLAWAMVAAGAALLAVSTLAEIVAGPRVGVRSSAPARRQSEG
jgi:hypothetical protein